jgi:hypothetical protein
LLASNPVPGLTLDLGGKIPLTFDGNNTTYQKPFTIALGAKYTAGDLGVLGRVDADVDGYSEASEGAKTEKPLNVNFHLLPSYFLASLDATVEVEFGLDFTGGDNGGTKVGFGLWLDRDLGKGNIQTGVGYTLASDVGGTKDSALLTVPIIITYSF